MKKRALLIGINNYLHYKEKSLNGCVNDTKIMASVLKKRFGFNEDDIIILNDEEATRDAIVRELNHILEVCESNDIIVFHFSGHGSRRRSWEANAPDGLEETIVPYDTGPHPESDRDIRDSDLRNWLALLTKKTANINLIFDNCHSGSIVRGEKTRGLNTDLRESSPSSVKASAIQTVSKNLFPPTSANWLSLSNYYSLLTACEKAEFAWEYTTIEDDRKTRYGAFTWFLVQELLNAPLHFTYQDVFEQLRINMQTSFLLQNPQIEGNKTRQLFSDVKTDVMQYVSVKKRTENKIILSAGAVHGVTTNSQWAIYPAGTKHALTENKIGNAIITNVDSVTSDAEIAKGENNHKIEAGCRAVEEVHYYKDRKKSVYIDSFSNELERIKAIVADDIKESSWLTLNDSTNGADFIVSLSMIGLENPANNEFRIKILQAGNENHVLLEMTGSSDSGIFKIRRNLETLSKYSMVSELKNPSSKLKDSVEFTLLQNINGEWREAESVYRDLPKYVEDEPIAFRIINKSPAVIYVSVLDLGLTKKISLLYPPQAASERVGSNQAATEKNCDMGILQVGVNPNESITLFIPETAHLTDLSDITQKGGIEIFKLIGTIEQTDFSWIEQDGMITRQMFNSSLEELLYEYLSERQTRETRSDIKKLDEWFTIEHAFYLCKK